MSVEDFRLVVSIGILWIVLTIKTAKTDIVRAIRELSEKNRNG